MTCKFCGQPVHGEGRCDYHQLRSQSGVRYDRIRDLEESLRVARLEADAHKKLEGVGRFFVHSLVSHRTLKPRIDLQFDEIHVQFDTDAAMDIAKNIIECCAGSYADAFLVHFFREKIGIDDAKLGQLVSDFRDYRLTLAEEFERMQASDEGEPKP